MSPVSPVFHTVVTVSIGLKKWSQIRNIHSAILDVYGGWQIAQIFPFIFLQNKLDKNLALSPLSPWKLVLRPNSHCMEYWRNWWHLYSFHVFWFQQVGIMICYVIWEGGYNICYKMSCRGEGSKIRQNCVT